MHKNRIPRGQFTKEERKFLNLIEEHGFFYALAAKGTTKADFDTWAKSKRLFYQEVLNILQLTDLQYTFLIALERKPSNISEACKVAGCSRRVYYKWMDECKQFADFVYELEQARIDKAEDALDHLISKKNFAAVQFLLQTKGKDRGYQPTIEQKVNATHQFTNLSDEELEAEIKRLEQEEATKQTP